MKEAISRRIQYKNETALPQPPFQEESLTLYCRNKTIRPVKKRILNEQRLELYINGSFYTNMTCSPGNTTELIAGHLYTEGILSSPGQLETLRIIREEDKFHVFLKTAEKKPLVPLAAFPWEEEQIYRIAECFEGGTPLHEKTRGTHSCFLAREDSVFEPCEDLSRHNAVDKAVGKALFAGVELTACILFTSGRVPVDMIQKAIRGRIPVMVSNKIPTRQSIELARIYNITLMGLAKKDSFCVFHDSRR